MPRGAATQREHDETGTEAHQHLGAEECSIDHWFQGDEMPYSATLTVKLRIDVRIERIIPPALGTLHSLHTAESRMNQNLSKALLCLGPTCR